MSIPLYAGQPDPHGARRRARTLFAPYDDVVMGDPGGYGPNESEVTQALADAVAQAVAQAQEEALNSQLVTGCIRAVADLTRLGYGTNYENVVPAVAQAVREHREPTPWIQTRNKEMISRLTEALEKAHGILAAGMWAAGIIHECNDTDSPCFIREAIRGR